MRTPKPSDVPRMLRRLDSSDPRERAQAVRDLSPLLGHDDRVDSALSASAKFDPDPDVREIARRAVEDTASDAPAVETSAPPPTITPPPETSAPPPDVTPLPDIPVPPTRKQPARMEPARPVGTPPASQGTGWTWDDVPFLLDPHNARFLSGQTRRSGRASLGCLIGLGLLFMCSLGVLLCGAVPAWYQTWELDQKGVVVKGVVESTRTATSSSDKQVTYYVTYRFQLDKNGEWHSREQEVRSSTYARLTPGALVQVKVLPSDPTRSTLVGEEQDQRLGVVLMLLCVIGVAIVFVMVYQARRRGLGSARQGRILRGEVVTCSTETRSRGDLWIKLECRFSAPDGATITHTERRMRNDLKQGGVPTPGTPLAVLYHGTSRFEVL